MNITLENQHSHIYYVDGDNPLDWALIPKSGIKFLPNKNDPSNKLDILSPIISAAFSHRKTIDYNNVSSPVVASISELRDKLLEWVKPYINTKIVDVSNIAANDYFIAESVLGCKDFSLQLHLSDATGISIKVFGTQDNTAAVPATGGTPGDTWKEITTDIFGGAVSGTSVDEIKFNIDKMYERILIQYSPTDATPTNNIEIWLNKYL